jgi:hypothetical protein
MILKHTVEKTVFSFHPRLRDPQAHEVLRGCTERQPANAAVEQRAGL